MTMQTFLILRRNGWKTPADLAAAAAVSTRVGTEMPNDVRWIRSYVIREASGALATACIYQGTSEAAVREHAQRAGLRADEVMPVVDTVIVRPDPVTVDAAA
jgi:hypothetical protein